MTQKFKQQQKIVEVAIDNNVTDDDSDNDVDNDDNQKSKQILRASFPAH